MKEDSAILMFVENKRPAKGRASRVLGLDDENSRQAGKMSVHVAAWSSGQYRVRRR
jgi:hypothetical protein